MKKRLTTWLYAFLCAFLLCTTASAAQTKIYLLVNKNHIHTSVQLSSYLKGQKDVIYLQTSPSKGTLTRRGKYTATAHGSTVVYAIKNHKIIKTFCIYNYCWAAHRGYSAKYCENTASAFRQAAKHGADVIETDIRMSKDGGLYCFHDNTLYYKTTSYGKLEDKTKNEIAKIRYRWGNNKICTFDSFLTICKRYNITPWIHIKTTDNAAHDQQCIKKTVQLLRKRGWAGKIGFVNDEANDKAKRMIKHLDTYPRLYDEFCPIDKKRY